MVCLVMVCLVIMVCFIIMVLVCWDILIMGSPFVFPSPLFQGKLWNRSVLDHCDPPIFATCHSDQVSGLRSLGQLSQQKCPNRQRSQARLLRGQRGQPAQAFKTA